MDQISILASAGMRSRLESLDMLANNLANTQTSGYKADREFYGQYVGAEAELESDDPLAVKTPNIDKKWTDFTQGTITPTNNQTDFAISGDGFFTVRAPGGAAYYTRAGAFKLDEQGNLLTLDKYPVLDISGSPIRVRPDQTFEVTPNGIVQQGGAAIAQLAVVQFSDRAVLGKVGGTYFQNTSDTVKAQAATGSQVFQGRVETSNVVAAESSVRLVQLLRQFEMLQKAISVNGEMGKKADELARVNG